MDRIIELYRNGDASKLEELAPLAPKYAHFFTPLPLTNAFIWYNNRWVPQLSHSLPRHCPTFYFPIPVVQIALS